MIDDVWNEADLRHFPASDGRCVRLITTRNQDIAGDDHVQVDEMTGGESVKMLTAGLKPPPKDLKPFEELAVRLGEWPLLLELANASLRRLVRLGETLDTALEHLRQTYLRHGVTAFDRKNAQERNQAAARSLAASLDMLEAHEGKSLAELSAFPEDTDVPISATAALWAVDGGEAQERLIGFHSMSLIKLNLGSRTMRMHDVLRTALQDQLKDPAEPHRRILASWGDFYKLPDDYAWRWVAYHLVGAECRDDLRKLLVDFNWLLAKLEKTDSLALITDFDHFPGDEDLERVQGAIRLSSNALARDPCHLASQFCGRLGGFHSAEIVALLHHARNWRSRVWLQPMIPTLTPPGEPLMCVFQGHTGSVHAVAVTADGKLAVSGSWDNTVKLWDLDMGREIRTLEGHAGWVNAVAVTPDGKRAVSGSDDETVKLWDLETGRELRTLQGHTGGVNAVAITPDGKLAVSGSDDESVKLWDLGTGREMRTLEGYASTINAVAVTTDSTRAVSGSDDGTVHLWDLQTGWAIRRLEVHASTINAVAVTPDGKLAVLGSDDGTVQLWDLETGWWTRRLEGHASAVSAVAVTADVKLAVSGSDD